MISPQRRVFLIFSSLFSDFSEVEELYQNSAKNDITPTSGILVYGQGDTVQSFTVRSVPDIEEEGNEVFSIGIVSVNNGASISEADAFAALTGTIFLFFFIYLPQCSSVKHIKGRIDQRTWQYFVFRCSNWDWSEMLGYSNSWNTSVKSKPATICDQHIFKSDTGPDGTLAISSANGLVGTGFISQNRLQPRTGF